MTDSIIDIPPVLPTGIKYAVEQVHDAWKPYLTELLVMACTRRGALYTDVKDVKVKGTWPEAKSRLLFTRISDKVQFRAYRTPTTKSFKIRRIKP